MDADDPDIEALFDGLLPQDPKTFAMFAVDEKHHLGNDSNDAPKRQKHSTCWSGEVMGGAASCTRDVDRGAKTAHHFQHHFCASCKRDG